MILSFMSPLWKLKLSIIIFQIGRKIGEDGYHGSQNR